MAIKRPKGMQSKKGKFNETVSGNGEYCNKSGRKAEMNVDHVIPLAQGGSNDISNLDISNRVPNKSKGR